MKPSETRHHIAYSHLYGMSSTGASEEKESRGEGETERIAGGCGFRVNHSNVWTERRVLVVQL